MPPAVSHKIDDYESLLLALQSVLGVVVPEAQRRCFVSRVEPLLVEYKLDSLASLAGSLRDNQAEDIRTSVLEVISHRHTDWALCPTLVNVLHKHVFARLPENAKIWLVGCGQGQLAYALAMEIAEYERKTTELKNLQLFASDITGGDIKQAELASYDAQQLSGLSEAFKQAYTAVNAAADSWNIKDKISRNIHFSQCDLTQDFQSIGEMDLIICPEVLVYYSNGVKAAILQQFSTLLKSDGIFLTSSNQAITPFTESFERIEHPAGAFYRRKS